MKKPSLAGSSASLSALAVSGHWLYVAEGGDYQAKGGARLPQADAPVAMNSSVPVSNDFAGRLRGSNAPFSAQRLDAPPERRAAAQEVLREASAKIAIVRLDAAPAGAEGRS